MAALVQASAGFDAEEYLAREQGKDLLRFTTAGSVDDGKSTLIGRLLYDSRNVYEDQMRAVAKASSHRAGGELDLSLLTDGLRAEREQGITIDVAYRYFSTARRKFIIADTPGHEQYTRNMATGASTADLAIILIDARLGVQPQSRRHAYIAALLGIPRFVVAVNKMDLVEYSEEVFSAIRGEFLEILRKLGVGDAYAVPISAKAGDNVVRRGGGMPWFTGPSLLEYLETVEVGSARKDAPFRIPVQRVIRPDHSFRGYAGQIAAGSVRPGDEVRMLPSGRRTRVKSIETFDGPLALACAPMSVTLTVEDEFDISRGDMLADARHTPHVSRRFEADIVWLHEPALDPARGYLLKHTAQTLPARITRIVHRVNIGTLEPEEADTLPLNAIGVVHVETARPLYFDAYRENRVTGSAILIDPATNATVGALMIRRALGGNEALGGGPVTARERGARFGHPGAALSLAGREGVARLVERALFDRGAAPAVIARWDDSVAAAVAASGVLALVVDEDAEGLPGPPLPEDDFEAARGVLRWLEGERLLHGAEQWTGGEGI
jgi:sulfate adenylyltransferase large subunit